MLLNFAYHLILQEKLYQWILRQQEGGSRMTTIDVLGYLQVHNLLPISCTLYFIAIAIVRIQARQWMNANINFANIWLEHEYENRQFALPHLLRNCVK